MKKIFSPLLSALIAISCLVAPDSHAASVSFEEDFTLPIVYLNVVLDAGSAQDSPGKLGLANLATQMLLRGTQKRNKLEFFEMLDRLGGQIEIDVRNEGTVIHAAVLSENLDKFLTLLAEALASPKFTAGELGKLKKEIEGNILEQKGNDKVLVQYHFGRFLYGSHPYGNPVLGTQHDIKTIDHKDVVNYYSQNFSGDTLRLFGTGAAKEEDVEKWFTTLTDKLSALHPDAKPAKEIAVPQLEHGRRTLIVDKSTATQAQVLMGGTGMRPETPGFYAIQLANHNFGGHSFQARLMMEIRVKRGWTYGASNSFRFGRRPKHFGMYIFPKTDDTAPAITLMLGLFEDFTKNGLTRDEYTFAKDSLVNNAPFNYDTSKKRLENATTEYLLRFPKDYFKNFASNIDRVSFSDITPALSQIFVPENLALVVVGNASKLKEPLSKLPGFSKPTIKNYLED